MADTSGSVTGNAHEPSMEDILASIRRMIADDDVPAVNSGEAAIQASDDLPDSGVTTDAVTKSKPLEPTALVQAVEPVSETFTPPSAPTPVAEVPDMSTDLVFEDFDADFDFEDDLTIPDAALSEDVSASLSLPLETDDDDLIDIDDLIAEVEARSQSEVASVMDEAAVLDGPDMPDAVSDNTDIELVKSLMADLTEDDLSTETSDAELDEILSEIANIQSDESLAVLSDADATTDTVDEDFNVLLQIAQEAKADASAAKYGTGIAVAAAGSVAVASTVAAQSRDIEPEAIETLDNHDTPEYIEDINEETIHMADAAEDTIIQGEVEQATESAFASLASVVAKKDEVVTSGPAIGDLVKEALQPMLKEWLDKNLKGIVERSVAKEIKRISNTK